MKLIIENDNKEIVRIEYKDKLIFSIDRLRDLLKSIDVQYIFLSTVDISGKEWSIAGVPWSTIAMGLVREEKIDKDK